MLQDQNKSVYPTRQFAMQKNDREDENELD